MPLPIIEFLFNPLNELLQACYVISIYLLLCYTIMLFAFMLVNDTYQLNLLVRTMLIIIIIITVVTYCYR